MEDVRFMEDGLAQGDQRLSSCSAHTGQVGAFVVDDDPAIMVNVEVKTWHDVQIDALPDSS